jgi:hypothetical protein
MYSYTAPCTTKLFVMNTLYTLTSSGNVYKVSITYSLYKQWSIELAPHVLMLISLWALVGLDGGIRLAERTRRGSRR